MHSNCVKKSRKVNRNSCKNTGIKALSIRYLLLIKLKHNESILIRQLQDEEILKRHDFTAPTESTLDISLLPKVMQVKNFGKRSRTKYTHLLDQDTTASTGGFGGTSSVKAGGKSVDAGGCFNCGGPHLKKGQSSYSLTICCIHLTNPSYRLSPRYWAIDGTWGA